MSTVQIKPGITAGTSELWVDGARTSTGATDAINTAAAAYNVPDTGTSGSTATRTPRYPTNSTAPGSTPGSTPATPAVAGGSAIESTTQDYLNSLQPESADTITKRISDMYAQQIAAIKARYAGISNAQTTVNTNNAGKTRAANAASGVLGQDFGNANDANTAQVGQNALDLIQQEQGNEEAGVYTKENTDINTALDKRRTDASSALSARLSSLKDVATQAQTKVQSFAGTTALEKLPQNVYDTLYKQAGFDTPEEFNAFYEASRNAALAGTKLVGDSNVGFYIPQVGSDGITTYKQVIDPKPTTFTGGQYGTYALVNGQVQTVSPGQQTKVMSSGGRLWSVDLKTNAATPLTPKYTGVEKTGWQQATVDQHLAAQKWVTDNAKKAGKDPATYMQQIQQDPDAFLYVLNQALDSGIYAPVSVVGSTDTSNDTTNVDAMDSGDNAANATQ